MNNYPRKFDDRRKTPRPPRVPVPLDQRPENRRSVPRAVNVRAWLVWTFVVWAVVVVVILLAVSKGLGAW